MVASKEERLAAQLFFNAVFPVMQVVLDDDPAMKKRFANVVATVQISANDGDEVLACHLNFDHGRVEVVQAAAQKPQITLHFSSIEKMNTMFRGGSALPAIKGLHHLGLLLKILRLLMALKIMGPTARPKEAARQNLKVKMSLYMVTRALSYCNKHDALGIHQWCLAQPERIYQFQVEPVAESGIACYLRVKAGQSKSGHGVYTRRTPFVLFDFKSVAGAMAVLLKDCEFVEGVERGYVETVGSPEYAMQMNDYMAIIQTMLT